MIPSFCAVTLAEATASDAPLFAVHPPLSTPRFDQIDVDLGNAKNVNVDPAGVTVVGVALSVIVAGVAPASKLLTSPSTS